MLSNQKTIQTSATLQHGRKKNFADVDPANDRKFIVMNKHLWCY